MSTSGVYRPYTWVDILGSLNGQNSASVDTSTTGLGFVAEVAEQTAFADSATGLVLAAAPAWEQSQWGGCAWS